ncbi:ABC transporter substrate-binding protein [Streptomyces sp. ODS28]|uniref:ABC transporter substrate-binding protein n=1 Tax=Streptomyces sp. ODS28 TaxID=3136688 RepID=UPI0031EDD610
MLSTSTARTSIGTSRRRTLALFGAAAAGVATAGCGTALGGGQQRTRTVRYQGWAGTVTPAELAEDLGYLKGVRLRWVGNTTSGPQDIQAAATGDVDFGGAFNGAVVKMAAAKAPVKAVISYYGVDKYRYTGFYVRRDSPVRTARDLIGKRVAMNTLGAHSEAMLDTYLKRQGLSRAEADRVERVALPPVNTEQALRKGQIEVAALGDIIRDKALEHGGIRALFDDHQLLGSFSAGTYVMADRFLETNPDTSRIFVTGVAKALEWSRRTPREEVVDRMVRIVKRRGRSEDTDPLRYWESYGVPATGGRVAARDLSRWADWLSARGDIEPDAVHTRDFYTNDFNRYRPSHSPSHSQSHAHSHRAGSTGR